VRTPARALLVAPTAALAAAIAQEWQEQGETIAPATMPLMRMTATAIDRIPGQRSAVEADLLGFAASDLLCYRATSPVELVERQARLWQPVLDWAALKLDAALLVTHDLAHVEQPPQALAALARRLEALDALELTAVHTVTVSTGSLVLALAVLEGEIDAREAFEAGHADELYGLEVWGEDAEARVRLDALAADIVAAERLLSLLRTA
jgi:chaperone required for assembly of F1-ATPase